MPRGPALLTLRCSVSPLLALLPPAKRTQLLSYSSPPRTQGSAVADLEGGREGEAQRPPRAAHAAPAAAAMRR